MEWLMKLYLLVIVGYTIYAILAIADIVYYDVKAIVIIGLILFLCGGIMRVIIDKDAGNNQQQ